MKWNNKCQYTPASLREKSYEELYTLCLSAYTEGRTDERNKSLEAYRLRCSCLFGNKCMDFPFRGSAEKDMRRKLSLYKEIYV